MVSVDKTFPKKDTVNFTAYFAWLSLYTLALKNFQSSNHIKNTDL
jgi:hypothetical protein